MTQLTPSEEARPPTKRACSEATTSLWLFYYKHLFSYEVLVPSSGSVPVRFQSGSGRNDPPKTLIPEITQEFCSHEEYSAKCNYDEVILITNALYGHIRQGRCSPKDFGHFGCYADVSTYLSGQCSSKRSCTIDAGSSNLVESSPQCAKGLVEFLEGSHVCITGQPMKQFCPSTRVTSTEQFIFSKDALGAQCSNGYIMLSTDPALKFDVIDQGVQKQMEIASDQRSASFISSSHEIALTLDSPHRNIIITFKASPTIPHVIPEIEYENAEDGHFIDNTLSTGVVIGITLASTLVLCGFVVFVGCMCAKSRKRRYLPNKNYEKCEMVAVDGTIARMLKTDNVNKWQNTMNPTVTRNDHMPVVAMDRDLITINTRQLIHVMVLHFASDQVRNFGGVIENAFEHAYTITTNIKGFREAQYQSMSHAITLMPEQEIEGQVISFYATACVYIDTSNQAVIEKKKNNSLTIRCQYTEQLWNRKCIGTRWIGADVCRTVTATASEKFFFSKQAMQEKCPSPGYVSLEAKPGQQIQVKIVIPTDNYNHQNVGGIVEDGVEQAYTMSTNTDGRLEGLYSSKTHLITIVIGNAGQTHIVVFQANGCTDIESPHNAVIERNGDSLIVKCRYTEQVWNLKCIGTRWIGAVGTCKVPTKPPVIVLPKENEENIDEMIPHPRIISKELIIGIIVSATLVLCCIVFSVGYLCAKGMKRKYLSNKDYEKSEMVAVDGTIARMMKADNVHVWQNTMNPTMTRNDHVPVVAMDRDFITVNTNNL
ncbi:hypothetical protein CAPTEDRAFT_211539 [Capitella teleta]|uniref:SUEL-type lectin domain-containing protein n=1 Tax=Capitella teleta TaxID=283909 RepID=R7TGJ6_CAPTE|nr:hypothetical protein CAPTEDRAFT_211539 [Capitella teleta]|eukprot:ELT90701.1 hypothetical protein CAPTEDRAFT_211539 [Capitella teleta]